MFSLMGGKKKKEEEERCDWGLVSYGSSPQALPRGHSPPVMSIHKVSTCHLWNKDQEHLEFTKTFGGCLSPDKNLCKKKKLIFFTLCGEILQFQSWPWQKSVQKEKVDIFYTVWWDFALQMLTLTEICSKRKNSLLLYVVRFLHSQSWPWQKSVQTEKADLLHCVVRFCSSNLDLQLVDFHSCLRLVGTLMTAVCGTDEPISR